MKRAGISRAAPVLLAAGLLATGAESAEAQFFRTFDGYNANSLSATTLGDDFSFSATLPFELSLFGGSVNQLYINENGNLATESWDGVFGGGSGYDPFDSMASINRNILAPFWMDVNTNWGGAGQVTFGDGLVDGRRAWAVNWEGVGTADFGADLVNTFQMVFLESLAGSGTFDLEFNYSAIMNDWNSSHSGRDVTTDMDGDGYAETYYGHSGARMGWAQYGGVDGNTNIYEYRASGVDYELTDYYGSHSLIANSLGDGSASGQYVVMSGISEVPPATVTPEPVSMVLLGSGLAGLGAMRRRRRRDETAE